MTTKLALKKHKNKKIHNNFSSTVCTFCDLLNYAYEKKIQKRKMVSHLNTELIAEVNRVKLFDKTGTNRAFAIFHLTGNQKKRKRL